MKVIEHLKDYFADLMSMMKFYPGNCSGRSALLWQAYGAAMFALEEHPELDDEIAELWDNNWHRKFDKAVWGI